MSARFLEVYKKEVVPSVFKEFNLKTVMQVPKIEKIILSIGAGSIFNDSAKMENALNALSYISGQKACYTIAKKSIATFKLREGMKVGMKVTLRSNKMYEFMDRLRNIVLPRLRDFRGFDQKSFNKKSYSFGLKDYTVFPEVREFLKSVDNLGLNVTFVCNQENEPMFKAVLMGLGFPFKD